MDTPTVSPTCSRKSFFAKIGGLIVATGFVSLLSVKSNRSISASSVTAPVKLRPETRAVPRQAGSV